MTAPLTRATLAPLLEILRNPESPAFARALERLDTLDPSQLNPREAPFILAQIAETITRLTAESNLTAAQLTALRNRNRALQSYGNR